MGCGSGNSVPFWRNVRILCFEMTRTLPNGVRELSKNAYGETGDLAGQAGSGMLDSVQYIRAVAAYLVVVFHVSAMLNAKTGGAFGVFSAGAIGVDIFFVLSGFLMAMIVSQRREVDAFFLLRRLIRIAPLYYLLTCVLFTLAAVAPGLLGTDRLDFARLAASFLFVPFPASDGSVTPILSLGWTLNYEMFFYCVIAATTQFFGDRKLHITVFVLLGLVICGQMLDFGVFWRFYSDPIILEFAAGIVLYHYVYTGSARKNLLAPLVLFSGGAAMIVMGPELSDRAHRFFAMGLPAIFVVAGGVQALNFRANWLKKLGDWSYSTYLVHTFIIHLAVIALQWADILDPLLLAVTAISATIVTSGLLYNWFEVPILRELRVLFRLRYEPREVRAAAMRN